MDQAPEYLYIFPLHPEEEMLMRAGKLPKKKNYVGDNISFYPSIRIDGFSKSKHQKSFFKHIILNYYEFSFQPVMWMEKVCDPPDQLLVEYLIEICPNFQMTYITILDSKEKKLELNQIYTGYGIIGNHMGIPFREHKSFANTLIENLKLNVRIDKILNFKIVDKWINHIEQQWPPYLTLNSYAEYWDNFKSFKDKLIPFKNQYKEVQSSAMCSLPIYYVKIQQ